VATNVRKLSRFKYGVVTKDKIASGHKLDFVETLSDIDFLCWIDSSLEKRRNGSLSTSHSRTLEERISEAIREPDRVDRYGVLSLGLSDDAVNSVSLCDRFEGDWHRLLPSDIGSIELPIWVDHIGAADTRWQRFEFEENASLLTESPGTPNWAWTEMNDPRPR
jgi:CRISPR-associated protein Cas5t